MSSESGTSGTDPALARRGGGAGSGTPAGGRLGQRLSGLVVALGTVLFLGGFGWAAMVGCIEAVGTVNGM
jgi:signal peptidase I